MKKKIYLRFLAISILAVVMTTIGITFVHYGLFRKQVQSDLAVSAKLLRDIRYFDNVQKDPKEITITADSTELRVTWIDKDGTVLYDNDVTPERMENHLDRPEVMEAFEKGTGQIVRRSDTMNISTFYYAILLDNGTVLRVATNAKSMTYVFVSVAPLIIFIIFVIIALCVGLSHLLTKQLVRPIELTAKNLENKEFETPYKELEPFSEIIRKQHADILSAAKARQDFSANVSHELKTPLTAISGYAELLAGDMVLEEQKKHFYDEIKKNADRLLALINDIIRMSELDRSEKIASFEPIDLCEVFSECKDELTMYAKQRNVQISFQLEKASYRGNKNMLKELLENLVQNAIRYNNVGGKVEVVLKNEERPILLVKDNGIGIPLSEQSRVFERFYRVDKSRSKATGGTGLGLAIVKHIVELHDAKIELDSAPGVGTTVVVYF